MVSTRISQFILENLETILQEWEDFARSLEAGGALSVAALRDDAEQMLRFIAADLETQQNTHEQSEKAKGHRAKLGDQTSAAAHHGLRRLEEGFDMVQLVSEYRALRASVTRLWIGSGGPSQGSMEDLIRFNEAIDQVLAEAVKRFSEQLDRSRDLLMAIIGHDLRGPLSAINTSRALLESAPLEEDSLRAVRTIERSVERMDELLADLSDFTRLRFGIALPVERKPANLSHVCNRIIEETRDAHPDYRISFDMRGDLSGLWDITRIGQLLSNLIRNAVQHGTQQSAITVTARGERDAVVLLVHS